jgi:uncharacterized phosphosugar-binding protein
MMVDEMNPGQAHCESAGTAHFSPNKLTDVANIVIDNLTQTGDRAVESPEVDWRTGLLSTITGAVIIDMVRCGTARVFLDAATNL